MGNIGQKRSVEDVRRISNQAFMKRFIIFILAIISTSALASPCSNIDRTLTEDRKAALAAAGHNYDGNPTQVGQEWTFGTFPHNGQSPLNFIVKGEK